MTTTYQYQTIDPPGSESSGAKAINSRGQIIGNYVDSIGLEHGFLDSNGVYTTIDNPGSTETVLVGINSKGQIVRRQHVLDRISGMRKGGFLAHRSQSRSEDETEIRDSEDAVRTNHQRHSAGDAEALFG